MKPLCSSQELICHMKEKGITFSKISEADAKLFLEQNNYYLKLASYRFNYQKHITGKNAGKYINLDFAFLKELSTIDMYLRYQILDMCLDVEHFIKVKLLHEIEMNDQEDGYQLIQKFISKDRRLSSLSKIQDRKSSEYCKDLIEKYYPYFPAWVFVEVISFSELAYLIGFYDKMYSVCICEQSLLNSCRDIRNASAHSNCLINHLYAGDHNPDPNIVRQIKQFSSFKGNSVNKKTKNKFLYDFCCLFIVYNKVCSSAVRTKRYSELIEFFDNRMVRHKDWFRSNQNLTSSYAFARDFLDNISKSVL